MCHICGIYVTYIYGMCAIAMSDKATIKGAAIRIRNIRGATNCICC